MNQKGAVVIFVAIAMGVLIGMCALGLDLAHLYLVRNELQNAADAGALAGVKFLYNPDGLVNPLANGIAKDAAIATDSTIANKADKLNVEVLDSEVERGHWCFATKTFTPNDTLLPVSFSPPYEFSDLDSNLGFVNAIRIKTRRGGTGEPGSTPAICLFARFWGYLGFNLEASAVAYIGFSQAIEKNTINIPIAICQEAVMIDSDGDGKLDEYICDTGRMVNSSGGGTDTNTGAWTNYTQNSPVSDCRATNSQSIPSDLSNDTYVYTGLAVSANNGSVTPILNEIVSTWKQQAESNVDSRGYPTKSWRLKFPLIKCGELGALPDQNCQNFPVVGTIEMDVVWIVNNEDKFYQNIPAQMDDWNYPVTWNWSDKTDPAVNQRKACWDDFTSHFGLKSYGQADYTPYAGVSAGGGSKAAAIYVKPVCTPYVGPNNGVLFGFYWINPVLVQ